MLAQSHFGFAKGPVLIPHQAKHRQQLRLRELPLAELGALRRQHCFTDFQRQPGEFHQSNFRHRHLRRRLSSFRLTRFLSTTTLTYRGCQQSQTRSKKPSLKITCLPLAKLLLTVVVVPDVVVLLKPFVLFFPGGE